MALPLEDLFDASNAELDAEITDAEQHLREAAAVPYEPAKAADTLAQMERAAEKLKPVKGERQRRKQSRQQTRFEAGLRANREFRKASEEKARKDAELKAERAAALEALLMLEYRLPKGPRYVPSRLTRSEGEALLKIARSLEDGVVLGRKDRARHDALIDKAADEPGLCERVREDAKREREARAAEKAQRAALKQRPAPAPGSLILPGYLGDWLGSRRPGSLDVHKLGVLSALALGFETHRPTLVGARVELDPDGEAVLVDPAEPLRLISNPQDGSRATAQAIRYLHKNGLVTFERDGRSVRISAGPKLRTLYGTEGGDD